MRASNFLVILVSVLIISCDDDGTLFTGPTETQEDYVSDLSGYGCSNSSLCYPLEEVYYDFSNNNLISQVFYKYNLIDIVTGSYSDIPQNTLELNSFNSSYFVAVPSSSITSGDEEDEIIIIDEEGNFSFDTDVVVALIEDSSEELSLSSNLELVSSNFNIIDYVIWNPDQGRYNFLTTSADRDTTKYIYNQKYDSLTYSTLVDTVLTPIYGDIILIDQNEDVFRFFTEYDSLENSNPIRAKRRMDYKIKDTYVPTDGLMFRKTTDCNDNYRKDSEEMVIFSGYDIDTSGTEAESFQSRCESQDGTLTIDSSDLCNSICSYDDEDDITMAEFCIEEYVSDNRMTGLCYTVTNQVDQIVYEGEPGESDDISFPMTFCDRGNNLYDSTPEYFLDQDNDGMWSLTGQNYEPFEDRNCNGFPDEDEDTSGCENLSYDESIGINFCDEGNRIWDNVEKCYSTESQCEYSDLYSKVDAPDIIIVTYESGSPTAVETAYPSGNYFDTGTDGCFNELEDGNGGCLCEFLDTDGDDNINSTPPYDIPPCTNFSLSDGETNFLDLDGDEIITIVDVAASSRSPFDYGSCSNGFSGSNEDCCKYYSCEWNGGSCDWNALSCIELSTFCSDDVKVSCNDDSDCDLGNCTTLKWQDNIDPNQDDFNQDFSGREESNGLYELGEITEFYINYSTDETIQYQTYFSDLNAFSEYEPYIKSSDFIVTKELDYGNGDTFGGDTFSIITDSLRLITVIESAPIVKSKNMVKSNNVIDQINLDETTDLSEYLNEDLIDFYNNILNEYHIIKTEFTNLDDESDYDYMLFKESDTDIVKMIHPYYHFAVSGGAVNPPLDDNNLPEEIFWQSINLMPDTLLYSYDGNIIEGQSFYSWNTIESDTANYNIQKEYIVTKTSASLKNEVFDPNCILFETLESCDNNETMYWCYWSDEDSECKSEPITNVPDCLLVTRTITTTSVGSGLAMELISRTYLKPGFKIVKQDLSILWEDMPWVSSSETPFSILEYRTPSNQVIVNTGYNILGNNILEINEFENNDDFNYAPFRITNTMGLQRLELPLND